MSLQKLTAGAGYTYLTRQVAPGDTALSGGDGLAAYYTARGEAPGVWMGAGLAPLGVAGPVSEQQMKNLFGLGIHPNADLIVDAARAAGRSVTAAASTTALGSPYIAFGPRPLHEAWRTALAAAFAAANRAAGLPADWPVPETDRRRIRTRVGAEMFEQTYGRKHASPHELTAFVTRAARPAAAAVAGFDVTFSPVKSVSALWAIAPVHVCEQIKAAHDAAVKKAFDYLESRAAYTRIGRGGVGQVDTHGLVAAAFVHRDSRAGDPDLHTHVAISNKVQMADGRWLALDGRMLYRQAVAASECYNTALEGEIETRLGLSFTARRTEPGKRPIREITGINLALVAAWSSRRDSIVSARKELVEAFRTEHGRLPTATEMIRLSQQATLATRGGKHEPRSLSEQRATWRGQALDLLGPGGVAAMFAAIRAASPRFAAVDQASIDRLADATVEAVSATRARWRVANLTAEALRQVRTAGVAPDQVSDAVDRVVAAALEPGRAIPLGGDSGLDGPDGEVREARPVELSRADGASIFTVAGSRLYTSPAVLAAETRLVASAARTGAATITAGDVEIAVVEWSANNGGAHLNTSQRQLVRDVATTNRQVMLALAPAGTGKTTTMGVLTTAWRTAGGNVIGLAPQASAAAVLAEAIGTRADTVDKLAYDVTTAGPGARPQDWADIGPKTLAIIDEAALAGTVTLEAAVAYITGRGGRVLLVGDDRQRAAKGAGGALRDIEAACGAEYLDEVLRFTDPVQGAASLALRAGDAGAAGFYNDRGYIREVTEETATAAVYAAWKADTDAGCESVMIAPTLDMVRELNARARADLAAAGVVSGPEMTLPSGEKVAAGDVIVTKHNARTLTLGGTDFVRNNQRWTVTQVHRDGSIDAATTDRNVTRRLPSWYVTAGHVRLGYAATAASVQGVTVGSANRRRGTAHAIITEAMSRNDLYPAMTRATDANTAYVIVVGTGDEHQILSPEVVLTPPTAVETFKQVIARDGTPVSATTTRRIAAAPETRLGPAADAYVTAIGIGAKTLVGPGALAAIEDAIVAAIPGIDGSPAWPALLDHAATLALGVTPGRAAETVIAAAAARELDTARDIAAVIDYRLDPTGRHHQGAGPLPYLPAVPHRLQADPVWGPYLAARARQVEDLATQVGAAAAGWTGESAPTWAAPYLDNRALTADLAVWRAAHQVPDTDVRPAGPRPARIAEAAVHRRLTAAARSVIGEGRNMADTWAMTVRVFGHTDITGDDYWPAVATRLSTAQDAGIDVNPLVIAALKTPLPAEAPAAALWWRLAGHVGDTAGRRHGPAGRGVPWQAAITTTLGTHLAEKISRDPLWPVIVTRLDRAERGGADPTRLAEDAAALLAAHRDGMPDAEAAPRLLAALSVLIDPEPADPDLDPPEPDTVPPDDAETAYSRTPLGMRSAGGHAIPRNIPGADADPLTELPRPGEQIPLPDTPPDTLEPTATPAPAPAPEPSADRQAMAAAVADAWDYYRAAARNSWVPGYLEGRGIDPARAGYAPAGWTHLVDHLRHAGYTDRVITAAGLARTSARGTLIDAIRDRAVLPIHNPDGAVAAFTARVNPDAAPHGDWTPPKYVNTATTDLFHKSEIPYGLTFEAIVALKAGADLVIVEGPLDAQAVTQAAPRDETGLATLVAIAPLGTALTQGQLGTLDRVAPLSARTVTLALDNDNAGNTAAAKAWPLLAAAGITDPGTIAWDGKDPAEIAATRGPEALRTALANATPLADRLIDHIIDDTVTDDFVEERVAALRLAAPIAADLPAPHRLKTAAYLADRLDLDTITVIDEITRHRPDTRPTEGGDLELPVPPVLSSYGTALTTGPAQARTDARQSAGTPAASNPYDPYDEGPGQDAPGWGPTLG